jgi:hypothetical protein
MFQLDTVPSLPVIYTEGKFWIACAGALWAVFKASAWVKEIRTVDLANLNDAQTTLRAEAKAQAEAVALALKENAIAVVESGRENTTALVRELGEMRQDLRTVYAAVASAR